MTRFVDSIHTSLKNSIQMHLSDIRKINNYRNYYLKKKIRKFRTCTFNDDINLKPEILFIIYLSALVNIPLRYHMQLSRKYEIDLFFLIV